MKRTVSGWVWCLGTLCLCGASGAQAQACPDAEEPQARRLAERYAPILSFGPGERYFPTIPFFTAYDNRDAPFDFGDSARVARHVVAGRLRWDSLDAAYHRRLTADFRRIQVYAPAYAAVFYRVRCLVGKQNKQFWGFIRNDNQAFHRSGLDTLYAQGLRDAQFAVIEYFLYYLRDAGLEGHQHDIERVVVFTPQRVARDAPVRVQQNLPAMNEAEAQSLVQSLLVVVGTGHSSTTPNNVLVLLNEQASRLENPTILVELGGHSSAPDLNRDNAFQVGLDVNWNLRGSVWGTRDAQSVAGLGFIGHYEDWMTLPRSACISATLAPGSTADRSREFIQAKVDSAQQMPCGALQGPAVPEVPAVRYALLPVGPFERLARQVSAIARARSSADTTAVLDTVRSVVNGELRPALDPLWGFPGFPDASDAKVLTALGGMGYWRTVEHAGGTRIWDHPDYRKSPIRVLKRRLFRPTVRGIQNVGDVASLFYGAMGIATGDGSQQLALGMIVPAVDLPIPIGGILELEGGVVWRHLFSGESRGSFAVLYEQNYKSLITWYAKPFDYVARRWELEGSVEPTEFSFGFGASIMPFFTFPDKPVLGLLSQRARIRAGVRFDIVHATPRLGRFEVQFVMYPR